MPYVVDTNIFNKLVDGIIAPDDLPSDEPFVATHVQVDEINNTSDKERRAQLFLKFVELGPKIVPTESFALGVSRLGHGKLSDGVLFTKLKQDLDTMNKSKPNNVRDVLIAEVAILNGFTLLTADGDLCEVVKRHGGRVAYFKA